MLATANNVRVSPRIVDKIQLRAVLRDYVTHRLQTLAAEGPRGAKATLARKLKMSSAHMSNVTVHGRGISDDIVDRFILVHGLDEEEFKKEALAWHAGRPVAPQTLHVRENTVRYGSELDLVVELIVRKGEASAEEVRAAFEAAGHAARKSTAALGTEETVREVMSWVRKLRRGELGTGTPVAAAELDAEEAATEAAFKGSQK